MTEPHAPQTDTIAATSTAWKAIRPLPDGSLDIVGDIHGEIDALRDLMSALGYDARGSHPLGRRLVFVGDFIDRGPDSPGVVRLVGNLLDRGLAYAVMGNHDLSVASGRMKHYNAWFFGHEPVGPTERPVTTERERDELRSILRTLPVGLARSDLRVVHACWHEPSASALMHATDPVDANKSHRDAIRARFSGRHDTPEASLALQNENPIKVMTSGLEMPVATPFFGGGKLRTQARRPWWDEHAEGPMVIFGHYWRVQMKPELAVFHGYELDEWLGSGRAMCIDYSVGWRANERRQGKGPGEFTGRLAALRWPECELVFDDGERRPVVPRRSAPQ